MNKFIGWLITMNLVNIFWVFFRAKDLASAFKVIKGMFNISSLMNINLISVEFLRFSSGYLGNFINGVILTVVSIIILFNKNSYKKLNDFKLGIFFLIEQFFYFSVSLLLVNRVQEFLYFNF